MILPVRNGRQYLERCLDSILRQPQGAGRFTLLLVDDCSTDGTAEAARAYSDRYCNDDGGNSEGRLEIVTLTSHKGLSHALDAG